MNKKKLAIIFTTVILVVAVTAGLVWFEAAGSKSYQLYIYPISIGEKTYSITVLTNIDSKPEVSLSNMSLSDLPFVEVYFRGGSRTDDAFFNATIPNDLLGGNISLVWKYYVQNPDTYVLSNNGTCNSIRMSFHYDPHFSGMGYFMIKGTEGAW
jgi:hypothetical protein